MSIHLKFSSSDGVRRVFYWVPNTASELVSFGCPVVSDVDKTKIIRAFNPFLEAGRFPQNEEKFKYLEDGIYEIKATSQLRLCGIYDKNDFIVFYCFRKKRMKISKQTMKTIKDKRKDCYAECQSERNRCLR